MPRFLGVPLHNTEADFLSQASDFLQQLKCNLRTRFSDPDPVAKATRVLNFFRWPAEDGMALASYANEYVHLIAAHFAAVLGPLPKVVHRFLALKVHLCERLKAGAFPLCHAFQEKAEPALVKDVVADFYQVWDVVLAWDVSEYGDIQAVVSISLCALDCTAVVESCSATVNYIKRLHRAHNTTSVMNDYLMALLWGPPLAK